MMSSSAAPVLTEAAARELREALACAVCREWLDDPVCLSCGHLLCRVCAVSAFEVSSAPSCVVCRKAVSKRIAAANGRNAQVDLIRVVEAAKAYLDGP